MNFTRLLCACSLLAALVLPAAAQTSQAASQEPTLPYSPSLELSSIDKSVDPCANFYQYSCGGWQKKNPIPPEQTSWSVYAKLYEDNLHFLRGILEQAAASPDASDATTRLIGNFYAACMDQAGGEKRGLKTLQPQLDAVAHLQSAQELAPLLASLHLHTPGRRSILFDSGSAQNLDNSEQQIAQIDQGGLGLPDRDYYTKDDAKSKETRERYVQHVQRIFGLLGDDPETSRKNAATMMRMETAMAKASLTRVERRDPYKLKHQMNFAGVIQMAPNFDWQGYYRELQYPKLGLLNVTSPEFFKHLNSSLAGEPLDAWKAYLRFHVADNAAPYLSAAFVQEDFEFYRKYLLGAKQMQPRWERCVINTDRNLGEALGQAYVRKVFSPQLKQETLQMVLHIEDAMETRIKGLSWMSPKTKQQAITKLHGIRNKIGYPDKWRDYSAVTLLRDDYLADVQRATEFEQRRDIAKVGQPVDHSEWEITPPTVDAYYNPQMNDINFPAGVLQPPLYDASIDDAPNYGNTGGTIGHELTHGFDDEGSQFDAMGNLKNWWTKEDRNKFDQRTSCVRDQYSSYVVVDDVHINGALTLGEDVADLGGEILSYMAWKSATKEKNLQPIEGLTPEQRFFIGFAQWDCTNDRPEELRVRTQVDPHSPAQYRINGVMVNMPEFAQAFACKQGQPMVKAPDKVCRVW
jgi:putative endopeptidase